MLDAEPFPAGATPAGLDFIADEDAAVIADDLLNDLEILLRRRDVSAHTLDGLRDETGDAAAGGGADEILHVLRASDFATGISQTERTTIAVRVDRMDHARLRGPELPGSLTGDGHRHRGAPMIRVAESDDFAIAGVAARGEDGRFVGLGPAVGEEGFGKFSIGRETGDLFCQGSLRFVGEESGDMLQRVDLTMDCSVHLIVAVADADGDDAAEEIEVLVAVSVPHVLVLGAGDDQGLLEKMENGGEEEFLVGEDHFLFSQCWPPGCVLFGSVYPDWAGKVGTLTDPC